MIKKNLIFIAFCFYISIAFSQNKNKNPDLMTLVKDLIQTEKTGQNMKQVWWLPEVYWEVALKDSPLGTQALIDEISTIFKDYSLFILLDAELTAFSGIKKNKILDLELVVNNNSYKPLKSYSDEIQSMIDVLKPTFSKMLGEVGENIEFFVFDNTFSDAISPTKETVFQLNFNNSSFEYNLPLPSLVREKKCPIDNKKHNGSWKFCPYHGEELISDN
ncbi:hypothetical protein HNV10_09265 [Winogradskyella litoriviva]|uniref:Uncharacterized protein n=1 Tax=Winogradskyella litoriviva TaxID=1220182 RepID=A0ABX2E4L2_9FLAO|nr:hypothetical protein [Winogradskyella litoriviva]NRD23429.1 hypothetical protein [Winogradskyella litoriviva]